MKRLIRGSLVTITAALLAGPLAADWLVFEDGTRLQTRSEWKELGKLVVFTTMEGQLASLRLDAIDLEASRHASKTLPRPSAPASVPAPAKTEPAVFVLTNADVGHSPPESTEEDETVPADVRDEGPTAQSAQAERLVVTDWQEAQMPEEAGIRITGTLRNAGSSVATRVRMTTLVYDAGGDLLAAKDALLSSQALMPGKQARFQVDFDGVYGVAAVNFRPSTIALDVGAPESDAQSDGFSQATPSSR